MSSPNTPQQVVVLFGGRSPEHPVSRVSAATVVAALRPDRYRVTTVSIDRNGVWRRTDGTVDDSELGGLALDGEQIEPFSLLAGIAADDPRAVVIPVLHGPNGEDGSMQGLLELANIAYVGCGVLASAAAMDKSMTKRLLEAADIPQARYVAARRSEVDSARLDAIATDLGYPMFVKPANMGSSVGVSKAEHRQQLGDALTEAARYDEMIVFEEQIVGREVEIGVLGNDEPRTSVAGEIVTDAHFYHFDDKYRDGVAETIVPTDLTETELAEMSDLAVRTFRAVGAQGLARVDMFLRDDGTFVVNEINTFPGFTSISMFPMMWKAAGLDHPALLDEMIRLGLERFQRRQRPGLDPT